MNEHTIVIERTIEETHTLTGSRASWPAQIDRILANVGTSEAVEPDDVTELSPEARWDTIQRIRA